MTANQSADQGQVTGVEHWTHKGEVRLFLWEKFAGSPEGKPAVLFVCIQNAGGSEMVSGYLRHLVGDRIEVFSAGSAPAAMINPVAVPAMAEAGIDSVPSSPRSSRRMP